MKFEYSEGMAGPTEQRWYEKQGPPRVDRGSRSEEIMMQEQTLEKGREKKWEKNKTTTKNLEIRRRRNPKMFKINL